MISYYKHVNHSIKDVKLSLYVCHIISCKKWYGVQQFFHRFFRGRPSNLSPFGWIQKRSWNSCSGYSFYKLTPIILVSVVGGYNQLCTTFQFISRYLDCFCDLTFSNLLIYICVCLKQNTRMYFWAILYNNTLCKRQ